MKEKRIVKVESSEKRGRGDMGSLGVGGGRESRRWLAGFVEWLVDVAHRCPPFQA
jgi:hypothetical protein